MLSHPTRLLRWVALIASGAIVFQNTASCDLIFQAVQTGLLAVLTGGTLFLASNV